MAQSYLIEVAHKAGITDPVGKGLTQDIAHLSLGRVKKVLSAQLYRLDGNLSVDERRRIAEDLLCDPILQDYREDSSVKSQGQEGFLVIDIWYKAGVTDVVGDSVLKGIQDLSIPGVKTVRTGMRYHLEGVTRREIAEKISSALLANPLVHDSIIHVH
jgi:phosphoribosylformylglycinamidine (FGAM) synthase PurS component